MMTLQYTCGLLLLVCSVAVALPQEGKALKRRRVNHDDKNFELSSDVPGNSGENAPVKFGRTIHQTAWSSEDAESSEDVPVKLGRTIHKSAWSSEDTESSEESNENIRTRDRNKNRWSFSNALKSALDFVNKLRGRDSAFPVPDKNRNKKVPKHKKKKKSDDVYWKSFKKWLRKTKILKDDGSLSSYLLDRLNEYNHKKLRKKPKRKSSKRQSPSKKNNRIRNSKPDVNSKKDLTKVTKSNDDGYSDDEGQSSKELSPLYKTKQYDTFSNENCDYSKSGDNKNGDSCNHVSSETARSLSSESDRHGKNNNNSDRKKSKITENSSEVSTPLNAEYVPLPEPQSKNTLKKNSNKPQTDKKAVPISNIATQTTDKNISPKNANESITPNTTDETRSNENINVIKQLDRENVGESHAPSSSKHTEEKPESSLTTNQPSSLLEEVKDENGEHEEKYETFLQYIYKNSNSSYFQALRRNRNNS